LLASFQATSSVMPAAFREALDEQMDFTDPTGLGRTLSPDEWWGRANHLTTEHGLTLAGLRDMVDGAGMQGRPGLPSFLRACAEARTPVLVVSAGFTDLIEPFLAAQLQLDESGTTEKAVDESTGAMIAKKKTTATVTLKQSGSTIISGVSLSAANSHPTSALDSWLRVSANKMVFDSDGKLVDWQPQEGPCHSHNKALTFQREQAFFTACAAKHKESGTYWLVLGDKPYDCSVTHNIPSNESSSCVGRRELRVGWFDSSADGGRYTLADYAEAFDLVLPSGSPLGLEPLQDLLRP